MSSDEMAMGEYQRMTFQIDSANPVLICFLLAVTLPAHCDRFAAVQKQDDWMKQARAVHARFNGRPGTFAQFGDSITVSQAFWTPLSGEVKNAPQFMVQALKSVKANMRPECWREWKGPDFGSEGGQTIRWADTHVSEWLKKLNPEVVLIMFGTNDLASLELEDYGTRLRSVVKRCQDNGSIVILSTIPPRHGMEKKAAEFARAARQVAVEMKVPLTDYHAEVLKRRPSDWDGASDQFKAYEGYEVPTLISRDGVHPSLPTRYANDYSPEALRKSGYTLRNYLVLLKYAEVLQTLKTKAATAALRARYYISRPPWPDWLPTAPPLPLASGDMVRVSKVSELVQAAEAARPGQTIIVGDGHYILSAPIEIKANRVTLRGDTGHRDRVILDGMGSLGEGIRLTGCADVTIASLTVQNIRWNGIKINSDSNVQGLTIYDCALHNIWQRAIKGVKVPDAVRQKFRPKGFKVRYCLLYNDHPKRYEDDASDTPENFRGNYIGGIDVMFPTDWTISDNVFVGIHGRTKEARGAVFLWHDAQDCIVERNVIIDCDSGICLGNSSLPEGIDIHCTRCTVRNNFVTRASENGILGDYTRDCKILNNTIFDPDSQLKRLIRLVHFNNGMQVINNLLAGSAIRMETSSKVELRANKNSIPASLFVDPSAGNLHLASGSPITTGLRLSDVPEDIDRHKRHPATNVGAHEHPRE